MSNNLGKKEKVLELFGNNLNCSQSILLVYGSEFGIEGSAAKSIAAGFGSGIGKTQQICGALSGAVMVLGAKYFDENNVEESKEIIYRKVRELIQDFENLNLCSDCRNLLGIDISTNEGVNQAEEQNLFNLKCTKYLSDVCELLDVLL